MNRFYKYYTELPGEMTWVSGKVELLLILALLAGLVLGCAEAVETTEPELTEEERFLKEMPDNVYFVPPEEAEEFQWAIMEFHSKVYIKDGRLEVDYQIGRDPAIPSKWLSQFYEALHSVNYMIETGEITLEDLERQETITLEDFLQPPDKTGGNRVPDGIRLFHHGGNRYSLHFSHEAANLFMWSGGTTGILIGLLGSNLGGAFYLILTSYFQYHYNVYGQGGGFILNSWGFLKWIEYPPPIEMDVEMDH